MNKPKLFLLVVAFAGSLALARTAGATDAPTSPPAPDAPAAASAAAPAAHGHAAHDGKHSVTIKAEIKTHADKPAMRTRMASPAIRSSTSATIPRWKRAGAPMRSWR